MAVSNQNGYVKMHRKMMDWEWYSDPPTKDLFLHLLLKANFKDGRFRGHEIKRGQAAVGYNELSRVLGLSVQQIRTAMKKLESTHEINRISTGKFSIVTVENYEKYQCDDKESNSNLTGNQQSINKQVTINQQQIKNVKNNKNEKEDIYTSKDCLKIVELYNDICKSLPRCIKLTDTRKKYITARLKSGYKQEDFKKVFKTAETNTFLSGQETKWKASFDWLINENNLLKVLEGTYDRKGNYDTGHQKNKRTESDNRQGDYDYSKFYGD